MLHAMSTIPRRTIAAIIGGIIVTAGSFLAFSRLSAPCVLEESLQSPQSDDRLAALMTLRDSADRRSSELVLRRITDVDEFVRGTAMEMAYRQNLASELDSRHLPTIMHASREDLERTRRWALALLIAHSFEIGYDAVVRQWDTLRSPYSRPFFVAVIAQEVERQPDGRQKLSAMRSKGESWAQLADQVELALKLPPAERYPSPFPFELRLEEAASPARR